MGLLIRSPHPFFFLVTILTPSQEVDIGVSISTRYRFNYLKNQGVSLLFVKQVAVVTYIHANIMEKKYINK